MDRAKLEWLTLHTAEKAAEYLEALQLRANILSLYQHYFLDEYQRSTASPVFANPDVYSDKELEFFALVDNQFFPLPEALFELQRTPCIPVEPMGTAWYYDEFDGLDATEKFLLCLIHDMDGEVWHDLEAELGGNELPNPIDCISDTLLRQEAKKARGMISRLPLAMELLTQSTGNIWLDITYESEIVDAFWTIETIDALRDEYTSAQKIMHDYGEFIRWLGKNSQNCVKVVRLWNRCKEPIPESHPRYLINALAG
jgi:hypothetical protein